MPVTAADAQPQSTTSDSADVVIVGAGPAGSATAIHLARAGVRVTLLDRARFPRDKACSEYLSPETVRQLDALGVLTALEAHATVPLEGTRVHAAHGAQLLGRFAEAGGTPFRDTGLAISRRVLDGELVAAARRAGVQVIEGATVTTLSAMAASGRTVTARLATGGELQLTARCVVGADGIRSVVARQAGLHRRGRLRRVAFVAHMTGVAMPEPTAALHVGTHGYLGINPIGGGVTNVTVVVPAHRAKDARRDATRFFLDQLAHFPAAADPLRAAQLLRDVLVTGPFDTRCHRSTGDGVLLVGDAADFFDPFTGEGVCTALTGAVLAASTVHQAVERPGPVSARRLGRYRHARRRAFLGKWIVERLIGYGMLTPRLFDRAVGRLHRRGMADTLIGVTGHFVSPWRVLNPWFLVRMIV